MTLDGLSLLAGRPGGRNGKAFNAIDPWSGQSLEPAFHAATEDEARRAIDAAADAFDDFGSRSPEARARFLDAIADEIEALGDALIDRATAETELPAARIAGERGRTCGQLRLFAAVVREGSWVDARIDTALSDREPLPRPDLRRVLKPIGPVVVKAHPAHPGTGELVGRAIIRAVHAGFLPAFSRSSTAGRTPASRLWSMRRRPRSHLRDRITRGARCSMPRTQPRAEPC